MKIKHPVLVRCPLFKKLSTSFFNIFDYPFPIWLSSQTTSWLMLSIDIYKISWEIFLQVTEVISSAEKTCTQTCNLKNYC